MLNNNTTPQSKSVVFHRIKVDGREIDTAIGLLSLSVIRSYNKIAIARLYFKDGSTSARKFAESDKDLFSPGNEIEILLGYANSSSLTSIFKGIITRHAVVAPEKGDSRLVLEAKDKAVFLTLNKKTSFFTDMGDKEILQKLLQDNGAMELVMDDLGYKHKEMMVYDCSVWDFMLLRAEANGLFVNTENGKILIKKPIITSLADFKASFGINLLEIETEIDGRRQLKKSSVKTWDFTKQEIAEKEGSSDFDETGNLTTRTIAEKIGAEEDTFCNGFIKDKELKNLADAFAMRSVLSKVVGTARLKGDPNIKIGQTAELDGVGDKFNGLVYITGLIHDFSNGWETEIQFGWSEEWFYQHLYSENSNLTLTPKIVGTHIAKVIEEGDDNDPDFKVKIKLPLIDSQGKGLWARLASLEAGKNHGTYFRPKKGDEVLVTFINEDARFPIIIGSLYSRDQLSGIAAKSTEKKYGYRSEKDQQLIFNDDEKSILLKTGECSIKMNGTSNKIEIKMGSNTITMETAGIKINSSALVEVKGKPIKLN